MADSAEEIKELKAKMEEMENRIGIQEDVTAIMNLMGKYELWHVPKYSYNTWKLFAMKQPDVSIEICNWGVWVGPESVKKLYQIRHSLEIIGAPITADELNVEEKTLVNALVGARDIRPDRYTILSKHKLSKKTAEKLAKECSII